MKPRYTKRVREEAALICAIAASTPALNVIFVEVADMLGLKAKPVPGEALGLACSAWFARHCSSELGAERAAAAEQLLRTGWSPGDPL